MSAGSAAAGETAASIVRSMLRNIDGDLSTRGAVEAMMLELLATDGPEAVAQVVAALAALAASVTTILAQSGGVTPEALLDGFTRGLGGGAQGAS